MMRSTINSRHIKQSNRNGNLPCRKRRSRSRGSGKRSHSRGFSSSKNSQISNMAHFESFSGHSKSKKSQKYSILSSQISREVIHRLIDYIEMNLNSRLKKIEKLSKKNSKILGMVSVGTSKAFQKVKNLQILEKRMSGKENRFRNRSKSRSRFSSADNLQSTIKSYFKKVKQEEEICQKISKQAQQSKKRGAAMEIPFDRTHSDTSYNHITTGETTQYQIISRPSNSPKLDSLSAKERNFVFLEGRHIQSMKSVQGSSLDTKKPLDFGPDDNSINALTDNGLFQYSKRGNLNYKNYDIESYQPSERNDCDKFKPGERTKFSKTTGNSQSGFMSFKNFHAETISSTEYNNPKNNIGNGEYENEKQFNVKPGEYSSRVEYLGVYEEDYNNGRNSQLTQKSYLSSKNSTYFHNSKQKAEKIKNQTLNGSNEEQYSDRSDRLQRKKLFHEEGPRPLTRSRSREEENSLFWEKSMNMIRTRNKPLLNNYAQEIMISENSNLDISACNTTQKVRNVGRRQSSSKKVFNSGSKSGSFLGDYVVDNTFYMPEKPTKAVKLGFGIEQNQQKSISNSLKNSKDTEKYPTSKPAALAKETDQKKKRQPFRKQGKAKERSLSQKSKGGEKRWERLYNLSKKQPPKEIEVAEPTQQHQKKTQFSSMGKATVTPVKNKSRNSSQMKRCQSLNRTPGVKKASSKKSSNRKPRFYRNSQKARSKGSRGTRNSTKKRRTLTGISFLNDDAHMHVTPTTSHRGRNSKVNSVKKTPKRPSRPQSEDPSARKKRPKAAISKPEKPTRKHANSVQVPPQSSISKSNIMSVKSGFSESLKEHNQTVSSKISFLLQQVDEEEQALPSSSLRNYNGFQVDGEESTKILNSKSTKNGKESSSKVSIQAAGITHNKKELMKKPTPKNSIKKTKKNGQFKKSRSRNIEKTRNRSQHSSIGSKGSRKSVSKKPWKIQKMNKQKSKNFQIIQIPEKSPNQKLKKIPISSLNHHQLEVFLKNNPPSPPPNTKNSEKTYREYFEKLAKGIDFPNQPSSDRDTSQYRIVKSQILSENASHHHSILSNETETFENPSQAILSIYSNPDNSAQVSQLSSQHRPHCTNSQPEESINSRKMMLREGRTNRIKFDDIENPAQKEGGKLNLTIDESKLKKMFKKKTVHNSEDLLIEDYSNDQNGPENGESEAQGIGISSNGNAVVNDSQELYLETNPSQNLEQLNLQELLLTKQRSLNHQLLNTSDCDIPGKNHELNSSNFMSNSYADPIDHAKYAYRSKNSTFSNSFMSNYQSKLSKFSKGSDAEEFERICLARRFYEKRYASFQSGNETFEEVIINESILKEYNDETSRGSSPINSPHKKPPKHKSITPPPVPKGNTNAMNAIQNRSLDSDTFDSQNIKPEDLMMGQQEMGSFNKFLPQMNMSEMMNTGQKEFYSTNKTNETPRNAEPGGQNSNYNSNVNLNGNMMSMMTTPSSAGKEPFSKDGLYNSGNIDESMNDQNFSNFARNSQNLPPQISNFKESIREISSGGSGGRGDYYNSPLSNFNSINIKGNFDFDSNEPQSRNNNNSNDGSQRKIRNLPPNPKNKQNQPSNSKMYRNGSENRYTSEHLGDQEGLYQQKSHLSIQNFGNYQNYSSNGDLDDNGLLYSQTNRSYMLNNTDLVSPLSTRRTLRMENNLMLHTDQLNKTSERSTNNEMNSASRGLSTQFKGNDPTFQTIIEEDNRHPSHDFDLLGDFKHNSELMKAEKNSLETDLLGKENSKRTLSSLNSQQREFLEISMRQKNVESEKTLKSTKLVEFEPMMSEKTIKSGSGSLSDLQHSPKPLHFNAHSNQNKENINTSNLKKAHFEEISFAKKPENDRVFGTEKQINTEEMKKYLMQTDESYNSDLICSNFGSLKALNESRSLVKQLPIM